MSDSMWKKEISFKRKPKAEADAAPVEAAAVPVDAPKQSLLKKEISFSRKPKEPKQEKAPKPASSSMFKKEISFSRKPKEPKQETAPKPASSSLLKKEISFSRKKRDREVERLVHEAEQTVSPSFAPADGATAETLPTALAEAAVAAMVEAAKPAPVVEELPVEDAPTVAPPTAVELSFVEHPVEPMHEPVALTAVPDLEPVVLHPVADLPAESERVAPADAVPVAPLEPVAYEPVAYEPAPIAYEPAVPVEQPLEPLAHEPAPVEPVVETWVEPVAEPEQVETWLAEPELPPAPDVAPAVLVHPPVPAAELPPLADAPKTPFWKKELSLSGKAKTPKAAKAPKAPKPSKSERAESRASGPFWKKELSLGRKSRAPQDAPDAQEASTEVLAPPASAPFWKKQMSFSKPSLALPTRSSGRGRSGGHAVKKLVGLKIGASQIAAAQISNNGVAELQQVAREPLAAGIVVGGELRDPDALGEALKAFFAKNKLPRKGVRLGIASNRIGVRIFDIVGVDQDKQLTNAVHFRAQETLPIPLDEAVLDYRVLDESVNDEGQTVKRIMLVVAYRELVDRYVSACRKAGITLAGIDLEAFAVLRALAAPAERGTAALVAVAIGHDRSTFAVSDGRICEFTRVLEWGGWSLNVALARVFDSTPSEVEAIKRSLTLDGTTIPSGLTEEQTAQALDAVKRQVQSFARELVSSLQFYQNQPGSLGIGEIVLTGGTTGLPGLAEELERLIGVHVRVGDPLARLKMSKRLRDPEQVGSYAVAIGLGIED
jgi:type IV pilus assembly protein PilM